MTEPLAASPARTPAEAPASGPRVRTPAEMVRRRFFRHRAAVVSLALLCLITAMSVSYPLWARYVVHSTYETQNELEPAYDGPSGRHWLGSDDLARDQFLRILKGGQVSLLVGVAVAVFSTVIGVAVGAVAGARGGWVDRLLMSSADLFLALPILALLLAASKFLRLQGSVIGIVVILALFFWMSLARVVRGEVLSLREKEFVQAARAMGASEARVIMRHLVPNVMGVVVVNATLAVAAAILTESTLSFLGFGIRSTTATWGNMLHSALDVVDLHGHLFWAPAFCIIVTVMCVNFLGDGLRDAFDPRAIQGRT